MHYEQDYSLRETSLLEPAAVLVFIEFWLNSSLLCLDFHSMCVIITNLFLSCFLDNWNLNFSCLEFYMIL